MTMQPQPDPVIPVGGTVRSATGAPTVIAAETSVADLSSTLISGDDVQAVLAALAEQIDTMGGSPDSPGAATDVVTAVTVTAGSAGVPTTVGTLGTEGTPGTLGVEGTAGVAGLDALLTQETLSAAVTLANPTSGAISSTGWTDILSHTVSAAEAERGHMVIAADVWSEIAVGSDDSVDRPLLNVRIIRGTTELALAQRYFRFTNNEPMVANLLALTAVSSGDVIKVQGQFTFLTQATVALSASVTTATRWSLYSPSTPGTPGTPTTVGTLGTPTTVGTLGVQGTASVPTVVDVTTGQVSGGGGGGSAVPVLHDDTLTGTGRAGMLLGVANPFTAADETKLDALPPAAQIPRILPALPTTGVTAGQVVIVDGVQYVAHVVAGGSDYTVRMTMGADPDPAEEDNGFRRGRYGSVTDSAGNDIPWLDETYADFTGRDTVFRYRSLTAPGDVRMRVPVIPGANNGAGTYTLVDAGRTTYTVSTPDGRQAQADFAIGPFADSGVVDLILTPTNDITFWQSSHADAIADWAQRDSGLVIPLAKMAPGVALISELVAMTGAVTIATGVGGALVSAVANRAITPAMLQATGQTGGSILTYNADVDGFSSILPSQLVRTDATLRYTGVNSDILSVANPFTVAQEHKLANIEDNATADLTAPEIKTLYESVANPFTDAEKAKLDGIQAGAHAAGQTATQVQDAIEAYGEPFTAAEEAKLSGIQQGAQVNRTAAQLKVDYESNADTNAFTDEEQRKLLRIPAIDTYATKALLDAVANPVAGSLAVVHGDTAANNSLYFRANTAWEPVPNLGTLLQHYVELDTTGLTSADNGSFPAWNDTAGQWVNGVLGDTDSITWVWNAADNEWQGTIHFTSQDVTDAEISRFTGQATANDPIALGKLPPVLGILARIYQKGGYRAWPDLTVEISGPVITAGAVPSSLPATGLDWGKTASRGGGFQVMPAYWYGRFLKTEYTTAPAVPPAELRINLGGSEGVHTLDTFARLSSEDTATHWYYVFGLADWPAGAETLTLEKHEPATLDVLPPDGSITRQQIANLADAPVGNLVAIAADGVLDSVAPAGLQEIYSGSQALNSGASGNSERVVEFTLDSSIDLDDVGHGAVWLYAAATLVTGSSGLGFGADGGSTGSMNGSASWQEIAARPVYSLSDRNFGELLARIPFTFNGTTERGVFAAHIARTATTNIAKANLTFQPAAGNTAVSESWAVRFDLRIYADFAGGDRPATGNVGIVDVYETALPAAAGEVDNTVALVKGGPTLIAVKETEVTDGPGYGFGGQSLDPDDDLTLHTASQWTVLYVSRSGITVEGIALPATTPLPSWWPAQANDLIFLRRTGTNDRVSVTINFNADQPDLGSINIVVGNYQLPVPRSTPRVFQTTTLPASDGSNLRRGVWQFRVPGHASSITTEQWHTVVGAGAANLLTAEPATDGVQRAWPATVLQQIMDARDDSRAVLFSPIVPSPNAVAEGLRISQNNLLWIMSATNAPTISIRTALAARENLFYIADANSLTGYAAAQKYAMTTVSGRPVFTADSGGRYVRARDVNFLQFGLVLVTSNRGALGEVEAHYLGQLQTQAPAQPDWVRVIPPEGDSALSFTAQEQELTIAQRDILRGAGTFMLEVEVGGFVDTGIFRKAAGDIQYRFTIDRRSSSNDFPAAVHLIATTTSRSIGKATWFNNTPAMTWAVYRWQ